jgi:hypothetical protein
MVESKMRIARNSAQRARRIAKLVAAFAVASPLFMASDAIAQLRTGRQSSRDFYGTSTSPQIADTQIMEPGTPVASNGASSGASLEISSPVNDRFEWTTDEGGSDRSKGQFAGNASEGSRVSRASYVERLQQNAAENAKSLNHASGYRGQATSNPAVAGAVVAASGAKKIAPKSVLAAPAPTQPLPPATQSVQRPPQLVQQHRPASGVVATGSSKSVPAKSAPTQSTPSQTIVKQSAITKPAVAKPVSPQLTAGQPTAARSASNVSASPSKVQLASCPSCNKGIAHTHAQDAQPESDGVAVSEGEVVVSEGTIEGETETSTSGCAGCGGYLGQCGCGEVPTLNIQLAFPYGFVLNRFSARLEAATFWPSDSTIPGLVRTGAVGSAGSSDLFGGTVPMDETVQGLRGEFGWLFRNDLCSSMQLRFFDSGAQSLTFDSTQSNATSIVRPYLDPTTNTQQSISVVEPGVSSGSLLAHATSDVYGGDLLLKSIIRNNYMGRTEFLAGAQAARLSDSISVSSTTSAIPSGNLLQLNDTFITNNRFYGGTLGVSSITYGRSWSLSGMFKLGLGNMERNVTINGTQTITVPGTPPSVTSSNNGLQARSTNNGFYSNDTFVVSPELNVTLGYRLTRNLEATVGYSFLELPKVVRAADQFDPQLASNLTNPLVGAARPSFSLTESNFTLHSVNYGLQYRY